ncbi:aquaporin [Actinosynnema sp. NPDC059797]
MTRPVARPLVAEFLGSLLLAALVIGSGIAAQRLSPDDAGLRLLENAAATAVGLYALILVFGPVSGAHFNPVVSLVDAVLGGLPWRRFGLYASAQTIGCVVGAVLANVLFGSAPVSFSTTERASWPHGISEVVATTGLLLVVFSLSRSGRAERAPAAVGAYIGAAYWFTSSTSFANPAITVGRAFSDSFAGIAPTSVPAYVVAQLVAVGVAVPLLHLLYPNPSAHAEDAVLPTGGTR